MSISPSKLLTKRIDFQQIIISTEIRLSLLLVTLHILFTNKKDYYNYDA